MEVRKKIFDESKLELFARKRRYLHAEVYQMFGSFPS